MKKVLFICYYFPPMGMGGTQRSAKFVKYLPRHGWEPIVLTVKDVKYYAIDHTLLDDVAGRDIIRTESLDPLRLLARFKKEAAPAKKPSQNNGKPSKFLNLLNQIISGWLLIPDSKILWLPYSIFSALKFIRKYKIDVIYSTSPPHSAHLGGVILKALTGAKLVIDFRDDWTGGESQPNPTFIHTFFNRIFEKIVLKQADAVLSMCDQLSESLETKHGYSKNLDKFQTITNGYDKDDFSHLIDVSLNEKFTITHTGSISKVSDPEPFLKAISELFKKNPELKEEILIKFFGTDLFGRFSELVNQLGLNNIKSISYLPHQQALEKLMQSHLLLLTIFRRTKEEIITSKVFEYLASGKPILLISCGGEVARMITSLNRGAVVANDNVEEIKSSILRYYNQYKQSQLKFAEPLSATQFDREYLTGQLAEILNHLDG